MKIPFEKMPEAPSSMMLSDAFNPAKGSAQEFTNHWMSKVGPDEYFSQLQTYHFANRK